MLRGNVIFAVLIVWSSATPASALDLTTCLRDAQRANAVGDTRRACAISRRCAAAAKGRPEAPEIVRRVGHFCGYLMGRCAEWEAALSNADVLCRQSASCQASGTGERLTRQLSLARRCACTIDVRVTPSHATRRLVSGRSARVYGARETTIPEGRHRFEFSAEGFVSSHRDVICRRLEPATLQVKLERVSAPRVAEMTVTVPKATPSPDVVGWTLVGSGVAALAVGGVLEYQAFDAADEANDLTDSPAASARARNAYREAKARAYRNQALAWVGFAGGAALLGYGIVRLLTREDDRLKVGLGAFGVRF